MKLVKKVALGVVASLASISAFATTSVDYTTLATSATTEATGAISGAIPVGGLVLAAMIGWKVFKRFAKG